MDSMIAKLRVALQLETASFEKGTKRSAAELDAFASKAEKAGFRIGRMGKAVITAGAALAGAALVSQLKDMVSAGLEYASSLGETAQQLGVTTKTLQEYRYAASQAGVETSQMDEALGKLTRSIGEAAEGGKKQSEAFAKLGVNVRDAKGNIREAGDLMPQIAEGLKRVGSDAERSTLLVDLFGKSGQKLAPLFADGAKGVNDLRAQAEKLGLVMSDDLIAKADEAADKMSALNQVLQAKIAGTVAQNADSILTLVDALTKLIDKAAGAIDAWKRWRIELGIRQRETLLAAQESGGLFEAPDPNGARKTRGELKALRGELFNMDHPDLVGKVETRPGAFGGWGAARPTTIVPGRSTRPTPQKLLGISKANLGGSGLALAAGLGAALRGIDPAAQASAASVKSMVDRISKQMSRLDKEMAVKATDTTRKTFAAFAALDAELQPLIDRLFPDEARSRAIAADRTLLGQAAEAGLISAERLSTALRRLDRETAEGSDFAAGLHRMQRNSEETTQQIRRSFAEMADGVLGSLQDLEGSLRGGGFLDVLRAALGLAVQVKGLLGGGGGTNINTRGLGGSGGGVRVQARARGGSVNTSGLYLVGERGPELMVPRSNGTIVPNHALGGGSVNYFQGNLMTPEFWQMIRAGDLQAAQAGGNLGYAKVARAGRRRLQ